MSLCNVCQGYETEGSDYMQRENSDSECSNCRGSVCECDNCDCSDWSSRNSSDVESEHEVSSDKDFKLSDDQGPGTESDVANDDRKSVTSEDSEPRERYVPYRRRQWYSRRRYRSRSNSNERGSNDRRHNRWHRYREDSRDRNVSGDDRDEPRESRGESRRNNDDYGRRRYRYGRYKRKDDDEAEKSDDADSAKGDKKGTTINTDDKSLIDSFMKADINDEASKDKEDPEHDEKYKPKHKDLSDNSKDSEDNESNKEKESDKDEVLAEGEKKYPTEIREFLAKKSATTTEAVYGRGRRGQKSRNWARNDNGHHRKRRHLYSNITMPTGKKFWITIPAAEQTSWKCGSKSKLITLRPNGRMGKREYQIVSKEMEKTRRNHISGAFSGYDIVKIQKIVNPCLWKRYRRRRKDIMRESPPNEKILFHGSPAYKELINNGFDERYSSRSNMFGAGLYFAKNSSKSNQYSFGVNGGKGCPAHKDKHCFVCERYLLLCRVTLGKTMEYTTAQVLANPPIGYHSVEGVPVPGGLQYSETIVYRGEQVYPEYLVTYKLKP